MFLVLDTCDCGAHAFCEFLHGQTILIDVDDIAGIDGFAWHLTWDGRRAYARRKIRTPSGRMSTRLMHRQILAVAVGEHIDHINGNGLDNRRCNLRPCSNQQNQWNRKPKRHGSTSQFKGVVRRGDKWMARITRDRRLRTLGSFDNEVDAAFAYDRAARVLFGEFACLNFPEGPTP